jgi:hypothetical protein
MSVGDALSAAATLRAASVGCKRRVITLKSTLVSARELNGIDANPKETWLYRVSLSRSRVKFEIYDPDCPAEDA